MHTTKLTKVGGSIMLAIPPALLEALGLTDDQLVSLGVRDGGLMVQPARRRYTLDELLDQGDPDAPLSDEDRSFLDGPPLGRELL